MIKWKRRLCGVAERANKTIGNGGWCTACRSMYKDVTGLSVKCGRKAQEREKNREEIDSAKDSFYREGDPVCWVARVFDTHTFEHTYTCIT